MPLFFKQLMFLSMLLTLFIIAFACSDSEHLTKPDPESELTVVCPIDTAVPISHSSPEQIGVYPEVTTTCSEGYVISSRDSVPDGMVGGFIRIWTVTDGCGSQEICYQSIGVGSPE